MLRAEAGFINGQGAAHERLGFRQPVGGLQQLREVVERCRGSGMIGTEGGLRMG